MGYLSQQKYWGVILKNLLQMSHWGGWHAVLDADLNVCFKQLAFCGYMLWQDLMPGLGDNKSFKYQGLYDLHLVITVPADVLVLLPTE